MGIYATDGSLNVTVVDGTYRTGLYAEDGSMNIVYAPDPVTAPVGQYHPCGARYATVADEDSRGYYAADGSMFVEEVA